MAKKLIISLLILNSLTSSFSNDIKGQESFEKIDDDIIDFGNASLSKNWKNETSHQSISFSERFFNQVYTTKSTFKTEKKEVLSKIPQPFANLASDLFGIKKRHEEKVNNLSCEIKNFSTNNLTIWRGNETHELILPIANLSNCTTGATNCSRMKSWESSIDIQSGDVIVVQIDEKYLLSPEKRNNTRHNAAVYQVTRLGHERCDATEGEILDITPLTVDGKKLVILTDRDLTEGINLLIVVSDEWPEECVKLRINVKSDNCGQDAECSGKGVCYSNFSMEGYECECCEGFAGPHCEEFDACSPTSPCMNNGICLDLSQGISYQCLCPYGFTGKNCEKEADPCALKPCLNGGTCIANSSLLNNSCLNGGKCKDEQFAFVCQCTKGYEGKRCNLKIDFCASNPCEDGYRCFDLGDEYSCVCPGSDNHDAPDCQEVPRTLCKNNHCLNGGTCWTSEESFYCACRPDFVGKNCEEKFFADAVDESSELLQDTNVITFEETSSDVSQEIKKEESHISNSVLVLILVTALLLITLIMYFNNSSVSVARCFARKFKLPPLIPFFKRKCDKTKSEHWLVGKNTSFFEENHIILKNDLDNKNDNCLRSLREQQTRNNSDCSGSQRALLIM